MKFIEVTLYNMAQKTMINTKHIVSFEPVSNDSACKCMIVTDQPAAIKLVLVTETYEEVKAKLD